MCTSLHGKAVSAHPITKVAPTPLTELYALAGADVGKAKRFIPEIVFPEAPKPLSLIAQLLGVQAQGLERITLGWIQDYSSKW